MRKYIIVGGNFTNNGAASMTFITVQELRKRYPDCEIIMVSSKDYNSCEKQNLTFRIVRDLSHNSVMYLSSNKKFLRFMKAIIKKILKKGNDFKEVKEWRQLLHDCSGVFDISGYAISSQWGEASALVFCDKVRMFFSFGIPYYVMPQSIGPFDFKNDKVYVLQCLKEAFSECDYIFAREKEGYNAVKELCGSRNLYRTSDLVLQTSFVDLRYIYKEIPTVTVMNIGGACVAVVPNVRNLDYADGSQVIDIYRNIVQKLQTNRKNVVLISHSKEDIELCKIIKNYFMADDKVMLIEESVTSSEYIELVKQFDFVIASRFHAIVHAYKEGIPCIALGWATKYHELLESVHQEQYIFDVRSLESFSILETAIDTMCERNKLESSIIKDSVDMIQKDNCFDIIDF